ncbi:MAG: hypothetical protein HKP61_15530 [Dactylosporangium sp.]|nr:hypothetical protein [Dactylosporangium sp.]NNJ62318.1 hypothetical protein [Dactylosporangium sp.]
MSEDDVAPDLRLRAVASSALAGYRAGTVPLRRLIEDLDVVWSRLSSSEWSDDFRGHWWTLEQVYAVAVDRGQINSMPLESLAAIDEAIAGLEALVESWSEATDRSTERQDN